MSLVLEKTKAVASKIETHSTIRDHQVKGKVPHPSPFKLAEADLAHLNKNIRKHIRTEYSMLATVAQYYFDLTGKRVRPIVIMLLSRALSVHVNPNTVKTSDVAWKQFQLAEIIEMIHTASLIHDDVLDEATTRRNMPSANVAYGNKISVLVGDYLLARASIALAELENFEVTKLMSTAISDLVEGEFMQLEKVGFASYVQKTYYKTASLFSNGCRATAVLGNNENMPEELIRVATDYGHNFGLAFHFYDYVLDYLGTAEALGKPVGNDLKQGVVTAPALYAAEEIPELDRLLNGRLKNEEDIERAIKLIQSSNGIQKAKELAEHHVNLAISALDVLHDSEEKQALINLARLVVNRDK